jgi:3-carboxy-cis,cis-muconate cycloisomerase
MTALAPLLGRDDAFRLVQDLANRATAQRKPLAEVAAADPRIRATLSIEAMARAFDVSGYLGSTEVFIDRALQGYRALPPAESR